MTESRTRTGTARIHPEVVLDGRLAIFHEGERWLAVADVHYGYERAHREAGGLFPLAVEDGAEKRIAALCRDYRPETLILLGDIVHSGRGVRDGGKFCERLRRLAPKVVTVAGNHDRGAKLPGLCESHRQGGFFFHHGHLGLESNEGEIEVIGHWHPAVSVSDGAGLSLKVPALIQERTEGRERWILPAFSSWAAGTDWKKRPGRETTRWVCGRRRVFAY